MIGIASAYSIMSFASAGGMMPCHQSTSANTIASPRFVQNNDVTTLFSRIANARNSMPNNARCAFLIFPSRMSVHDVSIPKSASNARWAYIKTSMTTYDDCFYLKPSVEHHGAAGSVGSCVSCACSEAGGVPSGMQTPTGFHVCVEYTL